MLPVIRVTLLLLLSIQSARSFYDSEAESQAIRTEYGVVEGEVFQLRNLDKIAVFRGIRFARKPQRFKPPEKPDPWRNVFISKKQPQCIQTHIYSEKPANEEMTKESEDCLFLRIIAPLVEPNSSYPVMVWLHGGEFHWGSVNRYGIKKAAERLVSHGVVLVSPQYRLGLYGFMSTGDDVAPGNYGLLDIKFALEWIQRNIAAFGGDPSRVTIVGEDAGATATFLLSVSPLTRDLFQRAILMSASVGESMELSQSAVSATNRLAKHLGCGSESEEILSCLSGKTAAELHDGYSQTMQLNQMSRLEFQPVLDGFLFPKPLGDLIKESPKKEIITGSPYRDMGTYVWPSNPLISSNIWATPEDSDFSEKRFTDVIDEFVKEGQFHHPPMLRHLIYHEYASGRIDPTNITQLVEEYAQLLSDKIVHIPLWLNAKRFVENDWKVWLYSFSHFNSGSFPTGQSHRGAFRGGELPYLFDPSDVSPFLPNEKDERMTDILTRLWTNFAKTGDPNDLVEPTVAHWEPLSPQQLFKFYLLKAKPKMRDNFHRQAIDFWTNLLPKVDSLQPLCSSSASQQHAEL